MTDENKKDEPPPTDPRYARFGKLMWEMIEKIGGEFCWDAWSDDVLPLAQRAGLCRRVIYDPAIHGDGIDAEPGCEIWYWGADDLSQNVELTRGADQKGDLKQ